MFTEKNGLVMFTNYTKLFKESKNIIFNENRPGRVSMMSTLEILYSANVLILAKKIVIMKDISERLGNHVSTAHKMVHDNPAFSNVSCYWVSPMHDPTLYQEHEKSSESLGGKSCKILLTPILASFDSYLVGLSKNFFVEQSFQVMMKWRVPRPNQ